MNTEELNVVETKNQTSAKSELPFASPAYMGSALGLVIVGAIVSFLVTTF